MCTGSTESILNKVAPGHVVPSIPPRKEKARHKHAAGTPGREHAPEAFAEKNPNGQDSSGVRKQPAAGDHMRAQRQRRQTLKDRNGIGGLNLFLRIARKT